MPPPPLLCGCHKCMVWSLIHLTISIDLAMNDLCYKYSQDGVCLNSFDCVLYKIYKQKTITTR